MTETNTFRYLTLGMLLLLLLVIFRFSSFNTRYKDMNTEIDFRSKDGFDQNLINRVDKLEAELNERASFGYKGKKDPFAGRTRNVALPKTRRFKTNNFQKKDNIIKAEDEIILMATILDGKKAGAIIMINDRSYTVNVGDVVEKRKIILIQKGFIKFRLNKKDFTLKF